MPRPKTDRTFRVNTKIKSDYGKRLEMLIEKLQLHGVNEFIEQSIYMFEESNRTHETSNRTYKTPESYVQNSNRTYDSITQELPEVASVRTEENTPNARARQGFNLSGSTLSLSNNNLGKESTREKPFCLTSPEPKAEKEAVEQPKQKAYLTAEQIFEVIEIYNSGVEFGKVKIDRAKPSVNIQLIAKQINSFFEHATAEIDNLDCFETAKVLARPEFVASWNGECKIDLFARFRFKGERLANRLEGFCRTADKLNGNSAVGASQLHHVICTHCYNVFRSTNQAALLCPKCQEE